MPPHALVAAIAVRKHQRSGAAADDLHIIAMRGCHKVSPSIAELVAPSLRLFPMTGSGLSSSRFLAKQFEEVRKWTKQAASA